MSIVPKIPVQLPQPPPQWWMPAANTNTEITAIEAAKRLGWRGIVGAGTDVAVEGIGAALWGIARIGLPILTLGLVMEGDASPKPLRLSDFPKPQPDPKLVTQLDLDFLKQQKTLAELSGNTSLAQILNVRIQQLTPTIQHNHHAHRTLIGGLHMVASAGGVGGAATAGTAMSPEEQEARARLKDPDPAIQWEAWKELHRLNPEAAKRVAQADLGPPAPFIAGTQGVVRYILSVPKAWKNAAAEVSGWIQNLQSQMITLDIRRIRPAHSLMDFMPTPLSLYYAHSAIMAYYFERLQDLRKHYPSAAEYLDHFVNQSYTGSWTPITILQLPSGIQIILQGHHRLAALIKAAREGIIPEDWLKQVPVKLLVITEGFPIPEPVILQIYAPAHMLTLDDLLPPLVPQSR